MKKIENCYVCDFETLSGKSAIDIGKTYVWAWSITPISFPDREHTITGNTMHEFMSNIIKLGNSTLYFHNLKFDGKFISDYLFSNGFSYVPSAFSIIDDETIKENIKLNSKEFSSLITEQGVVFSYRICFSKNRACTILDSYKKLPFTVRKIGKDFETKEQKLNIEYNEYRAEIHELTAEEKEYVQNDTIIIAEAMKKLFDEGLTKMTIGSDCLYEYTNYHMNNFELFFPSLNYEEDSFVRSSYKGGWCYLDKPGTFDSGVTYDVNSLYPSIMHSLSNNKYPRGRGKYYKGEYIKNRIFPLYVQRFNVYKFKIRNNKLPCVQVKNSQYFKSNEWIKYFNYEKCDNEPLELIMTKPDFELFVENYDIDGVEFIDGYMYECGTRFFDSYIDKFFEIKKNTTGVHRQIAKLMLNNLYGKFGTRVRQADKELVYDKEEKIVKYKTSKAYYQSGLYIPVAAFITAYARCFTIRCAEANIERFIYADTDSIHLIGKEEPNGINIDAKELLCWKKECEWDIGIFRRQKCYIEMPKEWKEMTNNNETKEDICTEYIKCSGMPSKAKVIFLDDVKNGKRELEDFDVGLVIENGKLQSKIIQGGCVLIEGPYTIRESINICF